MLSSRPSMRRLRESDFYTLGILAVVAVTIALRLPETWEAFLLHGGLLVAFAAVVLLTGWRAVPTIAVMFTLYVTLATVPFEVIPWRCDPLLARLDEILGFGTSPVLALASQVGPTEVEVFSFVYACFIPYLYLSILLGLVGRSESERIGFVTGFAATYALSFLGYLFVPARGPVAYLATEFTAALEGGTFLRIVTQAVDDLGGPHGAFPSLHVAASCYLCLFDLRTNPLRGVTYLPLVILIAAATLVTRYHYVVDLIGGLVIALVASLIARRASC